MARFVVFTRSHHETEAQLRILCITEDFDATTTLECQQKFREIARSDPVEVCVLALLHIINVSELSLLLVSVAMFMQ